MNKYIIFLFFLFGYLSLNAQDRDDKDVIKSVADYILDHSVFTFTDISNNTIYRTTAEIPENAEVKFSSPFEEWHYTMGVINMAMVNLTHFLKDDKYFDFAARHLAFGMDNYKYFQKRFKNDRHHSRFPFGQLWTMQELDDFGALAASMIEINKKAKREDYREYILNGAKRISEGQERLEDKTLVRVFPHKMTLWADDLYMSVPFLVRLAEFSGDKKYMDDAILQVKNFARYLWDEKTELYFHCYYSDLKRNGVALRAANGKLFIKGP